MCGFVGFINLQDKSATPQAVGEMLDTITHRGPDDHDILVHDRIGLGHRRLSILDLSENGRQPMANHDKSVYIIFNGEIYNFQELRNQLGETPSFRGGSDTEVLLRAYEHWGLECLDYLSGMFAFAILDLRKRKLLLARDHFGVKPLYYSRDGERFQFASEAKALLAGGHESKFNPLAALDWMTSGDTDPDAGLLDGIHRLPPGRFAVFDLDDHSLSVQRYYQATPAWHRVHRMPQGSEQLVDLVEAELRRSVEGMMVADVPVGTYCSGGIDSSLITAMASRKHPDIHAFNVAVPSEPSVDEGPAAAAAARHLKVKLFTANLDATRFRDNLVRAIYHSDSPLSFANTVPLMLVSELARENGVKVILSGEGADEVFGGYVSFVRRLAFQRSVQQKGRIFQALMARAEKLLARGFFNFQNADRPWFLPRPLPHALCGGLRYQQIVREARDVFASDECGMDALDREIASQLYTQLGTYLVPILQRADAASMAASIEARVPFLDHRVVELGIAIPVAEKLPCSRFSLKPKNKYILKRVAERYLPKSIVHSAKRSFNMPSYFYNIPWPKAWLAEGFVMRSYNLNASEFSAWLDTADIENKFRALNLEIWGQLFHRRRSRQDVEQELKGVRPAASSGKVPELSWQQ